MQNLIAVRIESRDDFSKTRKTLTVKGLYKIVSSQTMVDVQVTGLSGRPPNGAYILWYEPEGGHDIERARVAKLVIPAFPKHIDAVSKKQARMAEMFPNLGAFEFVNRGLLR